MNKMEVEEKLKDNKIPKGWIRLRLGGLGKFKTSSVDKKVDKNEKLIKLINYMDVYRKNFIDNSLKLMEVTANSHEMTVNQVRKGDILFTPSSETPDDIGHSAVVLEDLPNTLYSYHLVRLTIGESTDIDLKFRGYFCNFKDVLRQFEQFSTGVTRYTLSKKDFEEVEIILPISLTEQQKIAEILETVDETIEKTDAIIEKYKRIKQGLMQDLLTRGIDENGQIRSEKTHRFKDSPLGRIPEEWKIEKDFIKIFSGYGFALKEYSEFGIQLIRIDNVGYGKLNHENFAYLPYSYVKTFNRFLIKKDDIILALNRPITQKKLKIAKVDIDRGILYQRVGLLIFRNKIEKEFYYYYLQSNLFVNQLELLLVGSDQPYITNYNFKDIVFKIPPLTEQHRIAGVLSQIDETIEKEQKYKEKLERIKQGLMEDLLIGKVRVLNVN